jgi:3-deoxy-manno-octulosonate cytidylyltransferase (CMP-KDO synthetase)
MGERVRLAAVIPARMRSSRFPGKPLLSLRGLPMVEHVRRRVLLSQAFEEVVVATCDEAIAEVIRGYGGGVVMTSAAHPGALDRVAEAMAQLDCTHVVNIQGDEILIPPGDLGQVAQAVRARPDVSAWNAVARIAQAGELADPSIVKLFVSTTGRVVFCARNATGVPLAAPAFEPVRKSIGIMACTRAFLDRFVRLPRTPLEVAEAIDQSRILEHDLALQTVLLDKGYPTINERREVPVVEEAFEQDDAQRAILEQVLLG